MTRRLSVLLALFGLLLGLAASVKSQDASSVPTLVPPTLIPPTGPASEPSLPSQSRVAEIHASGELRAGILFNRPPFGELSVRGEVVGFDADLMRAMAEAWGVTVTFVQVTDQNAFDMLQQGRVHLLAASQVHRREDDQHVSFSQTYHVGSQAMMVRADDAAELLVNMANRRIGVMMGSDGERALAEFTAQSGLPLTSEPFLTLDRAYVALVNNQIDGVVASRDHLLRVATEPDLVRLLDEPVALEPYAIVMPRHDIHLRALVNRTLQYLLDDGKLEEIHSTYFRGQDFNFDALPAWKNIGDEPPTPGQYPTELSPPAVGVIERLQNGEALRVAGLDAPAGDAPYSQQLINNFQRTLVERMAARWGVRLEFVSGDVIEAVAQGSADLAVGLSPDWTLSNRVDFSAPYMLHGDRLMVKTNSPYSGFQDLRGRWVGILDTDPESQARAQDWASSINASVRYYVTRESDAAFTLLVENNADVIYGDSLRLIPFLQEYEGDLTLTERWYSRNYIGFALPPGDEDFRLLVEYTLQAMNQDGTLAELVAPVLPPGDEPPSFDFWPGSHDWLGLSPGG